jgi:hypothetical protein
MQVNCKVFLLNKYVLFKLPLVWLTNLNQYFLQDIVRQWKKNKGEGLGQTAGDHLKS